MTREQDVAKAGAVSAVDSLLKYDYIRDKDVTEVINRNNKLKRDIQDQSILKTLEDSYIDL